MEQTNSNNPEIIEIDFRQVFHLIKKWRWVITGITFLAVLTSGILSFFVLPPVYETKVDLLATQGDDSQKILRQGEGIEEVVDTISRLPEMKINSFVGQLKNPALLQKVIKTMKLDPQIYNTRSLGELIQVTPVKDSNLIEVKVRNNNPKLAADIANTLSNEFLNFVSENNQQQMQKSVEFLEKQNVEEEKNLQKAVDALKKFQAQPRGVTVLEQELKTKSDNLTLYQTQLSNAKIQYEQIMAGKMQIEESLAATPKTITINKALTEDPEASQLVKEKQGDQVNLENLRIKSEEINPAYITLSQSLEEKSVTLAEKQAEIKALQGSITQLTEEIKKIQAELTDKQLEQNRLQREVDRLQKNQALLAEKITQTRIAKSINIGQTSLLIVAPALVPEVPVKPKKILNMAIAFILGLMISVALAFVLELLDNTIKNQEDLKQHLGLPVLGNIPTMNSAK